MRRVPVLTLAFLLLAGLGASAQAGSGGTRPPAGSIDLVVMLDTSQSMFPYFDDLRTYLLRDLLREKLHRGDSFHLLSFADTPEVETAVQLTSSEVAERAFGRLAPLAPLGHYTDLIAALRFLHQYVQKLPDTNPKTVLILTDGIHDPPPGSPWRLPADQVAAQIRQEAEAIGREGWTVQLLEVPPRTGAAGEQPATSAGAAGGPGVPGQPPSYLAEIGEALSTPVVPYDESRKEEITGLLTGYPTLAFPGDLGEVGRRFVAPFTVHNYRGEPIQLRLVGVQKEGTEFLDRPVEVTVPAGSDAVLEARIRLPSGYPRGPQREQVHLTFSDDLRISPLDGTLAFTFTGGPVAALPAFSPVYVLYLLAAAAAVYALVRLIILLRRRLSETSLRGLARVKAAEQAAEAAESHRPAARRRVRAPGERVALLSVGAASPAAAALEASQARRVAPTVQSLRSALPAPMTTPGGLPPLIEMRVSQQNSRIGMRNVHRILSGTARSVGGGSSSFLVFLFRMPRAIAEVRNAKGCYTFVPRRQEFFPGVSEPVEDCIGKEIPMVGPKRQPMSLHFRQWVSALEEINALMRSVRRGSPPRLG